jgi:intein-encoded DNA endonuclease-like protein
MDVLEQRALENIAAALERIYKRGYVDADGAHLTNDRDFHRVSEYVATRKKEAAINKFGGA